ncbi:hypothetical protein J6590_034764, partial [Homalodisca vitripennis]
PDGQHDYLVAIDVDSLNVVTVWFKSTKKLDRMRCRQVCETWISAGAWSFRASGVHSLFHVVPRVCVELFIAVTVNIPPDQHSLCY